MNLKDYYTEQETESIISVNPKSRRVYLKAVKIYNRWWYPRSEVQINSVNNLQHDQIDLETSDWTNLSGSTAYWPYSRERLYQLTIRTEEPRIKYMKMNGQTLFNVASINAYINAK